MNQVTSKATAVAYHKVVKPLLFRKQPDAVHDKLLRTGSRLQTHAAARMLLQGAWNYQNPEVLSQTIHGITFKNPVGLSAGFDKNFELAQLMKSIGFGFMEGGSVTYHPCSGNPKPWFHRLPNSKSLVVHAGLGNRGVAKSVAGIQKYPAGTFSDFPLNISVAKTNLPKVYTEEAGIADYVRCVQYIQSAGVGHMITLNISCPNAFGGESFTNPQKLGRLLHAIDSLELVQPLFIKMPSDLDWSTFEKLLAVIDHHNVTGLTISNLAKDRSKLTLADPLPNSVKGNLSGKPTWELSNNLIKRTFQTYGSRFVIIGVGGIFSAEDAYTKIKLGAHLVELITGMIFEGPQLIGQINHELVELLHKDGFTHIGQAVGIDAVK
jgi:dihydroorotate dehydrogenase (fumarate)